MNGLSKVPKLRVGLYITCKETLNILWPILRKVLPDDLPRCLMPAHGSMAVAKQLEQIGIDEWDWQNTMFYGWAEFDGAMYLQQLTVNGMEKLLFMNEAESIYGFCVNHWRNEENKLSLSYAAQATICPVKAEEFFRDYAIRIGVGNEKGFVAICQRLAELTTYCRDKLFLIGFCCLVDWINWRKKNDMVRPMDYPKQIQQSAAEEYEKIAEAYEELLADAINGQAIENLRFLANRCRTSAFHIRSMMTLLEINDYFDYKNPEILTEENRKVVLDIVEQSRSYADAYIQLYKEYLPDRGGEGLLVSYCATTPVFIDAVAATFLKNVQIYVPDTMNVPLPDINSM